MKIDVEGHEEGVFEGFGEDHERVENVLCEIWPTERLAAWLVDRSYVLETVTGDPWRPGFPLPESNL